MFRKWLCVALVVAMALSIWHVAMVSDNPLYAVTEDEEVEQSVNPAITDSHTLTLWYTDEALTDYLSSVALSYQQRNDVKVNLVLKSGVEFLENINAVSIADDETRQEPLPDLYITSHDNLLRAYLSGIASVVQDPQNIMSAKTFPDTALNAVTCYGSYVGYPLYYETSFFLYNKTYMASIAQNRLEAQSDLIEGEEATKALESGEIKPEESEEVDTLEKKSEGEADAEDSANENIELVDGEEEFSDPMGEEDAEVSQEVLEKLATMIPATLDDITTFANNYDAPDAVESVFKWDVTDIFYNYFFVGKYMEVGGDAGDNAAVFNIYNRQAVECLDAYQGMNQFFTIDTDVDNYDSILQDFIDGKLVFTVATTDAIAKINSAKNNGEFDFEYGVTTLPDVSTLLKTRGLSVTDALVINGYTDKETVANDFASFVVHDKASEIYKKAGKVSCDKNVQYEDGEMVNILDEYEKSMPLPKMVEAANYWVQLEIAFTKIWHGDDPDETLKELSDTIGAQIEEIRANLPTQESFLAGAGKYIQ